MTKQPKRGRPKAASALAASSKPKRGRPPKNFAGFLQALRRTHSRAAAELSSGVDVEAAFQAVAADSASAAQKEFARHVRLVELAYIETQFAAHIKSSPTLCASAMDTLKNRRRAYAFGAGGASDSSVDAPALTPAIRITWASRLGKAARGLFFDKDGPPPPRPPKLAAPDDPMPARRAPELNYPAAGALAEEFRGVLRRESEDELIDRLMAEQEKEAEPEVEVTAPVGESLGTVRIDRH